MLRHSSAIHQSNLFGTDLLHQLDPNGLLILKFDPFSGSTSYLIIIMKKLIRTKSALVNSYGGFAQ